MSNNKLCRNPVTKDILGQIASFFADFCQLAIKIKNFQKLCHSSFTNNTKNFEQFFTKWVRTAHFVHAPVHQPGHKINKLQHKSSTLQHSANPSHYVADQKFAATFPSLQLGANSSLHRSRSTFCNNNHYRNGFNFGGQSYSQRHPTSSPRECWYHISYNAIATSMICINTAATHNLFSGKPNLARSTNHSPITSINEDQLSTYDNITGRTFTIEAGVISNNSERISSINENQLSNYDNNTGWTFTIDTCLTQNCNRYKLFHVRQSHGTYN